MTPKVIEALGIGFAPPGRHGLKDRLLGQGFAQGLLLQSGLLAQREPTLRAPARPEESS